MPEKMALLYNLYYNKPETWAGVTNLRVLVKSGDHPMSALGIKFEVDTTLRLIVMPMNKTGDTYTLYEASSIPPILYKLGSILTSRFEAWKSNSTCLDTLFREIRDCEIDISIHESS